MARVPLLLATLCVGLATVSGATVELPADTLRDKVRGGLLGQILGNLNGLPHENRYIQEPGNVASYTPALPEGAWTDDDTDFEWVYVVTMQRENKIFLPPRRIAELWKERINRRIWCANRYARHLMDLGLEPPLTGNAALNPWADFNISGQFLSETFALMAPTMPQTAARVALNYTRVAIDLEPAQSTQFFTAMIATAFTENDMNRILNAGVASLDPNSRIRRIAADVRRWHREHPDDWQATRRLVRDTYTQAGGGMRDMNGYELNTASVIGALLYGRGDFAETLRVAFNFGWDCDNTAATAGTIVGVVKGYRWMLSQGWRIVDRYANRTRENMPEDETITSFADRVIDLAERLIVEQGGERKVVQGKPIYQVPAEEPAPVVSLEDPGRQTAELKRRLEPGIEETIARGGDLQAQARAVYLAICLDLDGPLRQRYPQRWKEAVSALSGFWKILQDIYWDRDIPRVLPLREKASEAGLGKPPERRDVW